MKTYIALLRGINVSGQKKIKMADLRILLEGMGLVNVQTYIQSGNVVFNGMEGDKTDIENGIKEMILKKFGFDVPTLVMDAMELETMVKANPFEDDGANRLYFVVLKETPKKELVEEFNTLQFEYEDFYITESCVYLFCKKGYGNAKLNNNLIERKLKVEATTRNLKTMQKLMEMATMD